MERTAPSVEPCSPTRTTHASSFAAPSSSSPAWRPTFSANPPTPPTPPVGRTATSSGGAGGNPGSRTTNTATIEGAPHQRPRSPPPPDAEDEALSSDDSSDISDEEGDGAVVEGQGSDKRASLNVRVGTINKKGQVKPGKKWVHALFVLSGGSLHFYLKKEDSEPKASITVKEAKLNKQVECRPFRHCFSVTTSAMEILFSAPSEADWLDWTSALEAAAPKPPSAPPVKDKAVKLNLKERAKRSLVSKTSASKMGKRAIRSKAPREMTDLLTALKTLVHRETGSSRRADQMESNILRVGIKLYFLINDGKLQASEVLLADKPLRQALKLVVACHNHVSAVQYSKRMKLNLELLEVRLGEVAKLVQQVGDLLSETLLPHMRPTNVQRISDTVAYFGNPEVLMRVLVDESFAEEVEVLIMAAEHYSQFHFYAEDFQPGRRNTIAY